MRARAPGYGLVEGAFWMPKGDLFNLRSPIASAGRKRAGFRHDSPT